MTHPIADPLTSLDVIIPVKNRATVRDCVAQLRSEAQLAPRVSLGQIILCDGDSQTEDCCSQLDDIAQWPGVQRLNCCHPHFTQGDRFNKGWLLNQGLAAASAPLVLISDVDILWNWQSLNELVAAASEQPAKLCYINAVRESDPAVSKAANTRRASQRLRYSYRLSRQNDGYSLTVYAETAPPATGISLRPGCGLVCAQRSHFIQLGGYRHSFRGWGWEDQDLLIRAQLMGYSLARIGQVIHLSHGDNQRHQLQEPSNTRASIQTSRDRNILRCLAALTAGDLRGDGFPEQSFAKQLSNSEKSSAPAIQIRIPSELQTLADATHSTADSASVI